MTSTNGHGSGVFGSPGDQAAFRVGDLKGCAVVVASGEIDLYTSPALHEAMLVAAVSSHRVVLDLSAVTFLDSTGMGIMVGAQRRAREVNGSVCLVSPIAAVRRVLEITRLDDVFVIHTSLDDAVA